MSWFDALRYRVHVLLNGRAHERDVAEELEFHLSLEAQQHQQAGPGALTAAEARHAARRRFGNVAFYQEEIRQVAGLTVFDVIRQDLRFALRSFARAPVFTLVAVLTLAVGIGGNTAIFSAVHALLLRPLPFHEPARLMSITVTVPERGSAGRADIAWSHPKFLALRDMQRTFSQLTHWTAMQFTIRVGGEAVRAHGEFVDAGYLPTLGIQPVLGRNISTEEDSWGGPRVVMIGHDVWRRVYNGSPGVLGQSFVIDGVAYTVVGVTPAGFRGLSGMAHFWIPIVTRGHDLVQDANNHGYFGVARLADGVPAEQAIAEMPHLGARIDALFPSPVAGEHLGAQARPLDETRVDARLRRTLLMLFMAAGLVLLIACANVANLFLVRAAGRRRELGVRLALGAGRTRLIRQLLVESVLLSLLGGLTGVAVAWWGVRMLSAVDAAAVLRLRDIGGLGTVHFTTIELDGAALAFAAVLALGTGVLFGLVPALQSTRLMLADALRDVKSRSWFRLRALNTRNVLVVLEIAMAVVLLGTSGLMVRSLARLLAVHQGFDAEQVLTLRVNRAPEWSRDSIVTYYDRALHNLSALPGVQAVALSDCPPLQAGCFEVAGVVPLDRALPARGFEPGAGVHWISPGWISLMRIPMMRGRDFTRLDDQRARRVVLVNETAAHQFWPGQDPIGKPIALANKPADTLWVTGVVGAVRYGPIDARPMPDLYLPYYQNPLSYRMMFFLRTQGEPMSAVGSASVALRKIGPGFPIHEIAPLRYVVAAASAHARLSALLISLFAGVALILAALGVYGVLSYATSQRTSEISVRMTLGATRAAVVRSVVAQGVALLAAGATAGLGAALAVTRVLRSVLYDVAPTDPATLTGTLGVITLAVIMASWIPARRAARVPVMQALRSD